MGQACSCLQDWDGPYELSLRAIDISNVDHSITDVQLEVEMRGVVVCTPKDFGEHQGGKYVWNYPTDAPWVFKGNDISRDTADVRILGINKQRLALPLIRLGLSRDKTVVTAVPIDGHILTLEVLLQVKEALTNPVGSSPAAAAPSTAPLVVGAPEQVPNAPEPVPGAPSSPEPPSAPEPASMCADEPVRSGPTLVTLPDSEDPPESIPSEVSTSDLESPLGVG
eukprot:GGOE01024117.1.p1 GENE.GGOE01024117.1~~GGOE01024117.1.p1  ORF type:complete len:224 (-),score=51.31 GGOE01024117.1:576-1247(-)